MVNGCPVACSCGEPGETGQVAGLKNMELIGVRTVDEAKERELFGRSYPECKPPRIYE